MNDLEPKFLNPVPLIPPLEKPSCPDTSHIIREEFQKIIGTDEFPHTIAENLANNQIENEYLLQCGLETLNTTEDLKAREKEITDGELCLMESQAVYLIEYAYKEINKKNTDKIYPPLDPEVIEKFSLLTIDTIYPNLYKRILNNKLTPFTFFFKAPCPKADSLNKLDLCCGRPNLNLTDQQKIQLKALERRKRYEDNKMMDFPRMRTKYFNQIVFEVYPKQIVFRNFQLFHVYKKKLVLKNITTHLQHITIPRIPKTSLFFIYPNKNDNRIAPGMCYSLTVGFKANLVENSYEHLVIEVIGSQPIHVDINSYKDMPFLKGLVYHKDFMEGSITIDKTKAAIYNYTIDCGTVLYGCRSECNFIIQNTGGSSRFFLISETDWYRRRVTCLTETYRLILPDFKIYPAYFQLKKNEICEIKIEFYPTEEGLILDKLFLISENNNVEEIDLLGDCIYYEPHFFKFEMPDCPTRSPARCNKDVKNILHMGAVYYKQIVISHFYMYNRSLISIPYEIRLGELVEEESYHAIKKEWVEVRPECGTLLPLTGERFEVSIHMKSKKIGLYKIVLNMFAIDIPEVSILEGPIFAFEEEYRSKDLKQKLLTILTDKVEVQIHHIKIPFRVFPDCIVFPKLIYRTVETISNIQVINEGFCCLLVEWQQNNKNDKIVKIKVKPNKFELKSMQSVYCAITVKPKSYDDIDETLTISVNNGFFIKTIPVIGSVQKPKMKVTKTFVNFGHVKTNSTVTNVFKIKNLSDTCLLWQVQEYQYDYLQHQFEEIENPCLSQSYGELCELNAETEIVYSLNTSVQKKFFSILIFFTIYKYEKYESSHVILLGYIHEPKVRIETMYNGEDIFRIEDVYYVNESITKSFELHNDSVVEANYTWGAPSGFHTKNLNFAFDYNKGVLYPNSRKYVNITLILKKPGIIFDFYIPCYIKYVPEPIILQILCVIKKPQIAFYIPSSNSEFTEIIWPADFDPASEISDEATAQDLNHFNNRSDSKSFDFDDSLSSLSGDKNKTSSARATDWDINNIFDYLHQIEMVGEQKTLTGSKSYTEKSVSDSATVPSEFGLYSKFASETSICEYVVYFFNVKCKEANSKTFRIKNPMSYPLKFSINVKHFKAKQFKRKRLEDLYINLKWKPDDSFTKQLSDYGILVKVEPASGVLLNRDEVTCTITVYAETWGYYLDEISVEFEQIPIFYMNLVIQVIGQPIELPMLTSAENYIQFSNVQTCTFEQKRLAFIHNNATIPCVIVWHVFLKNAKRPEKEPLEPFNVMYDVYGFEDEQQITGSVKIVKYIGKEIPKSFSLFRVEPSELYLEPKQTRQIAIYFQPSLCHADEIDILNIKVAIVGNIYIEAKNRHSNVMIRNPNKDLQLINIPVRTSIPYVTLDLQCIRGDKDIIINVNDILNGDIKTKNMRLVFKNNCQSDIVVAMIATEPFEIISMKSRISESDKILKPEARTPVLSRGYLETIIKCEILKEDLLNIADVVYKVNTHYLKETEVIGENCVKISRILKIKLTCKESQTLPISVSLYFPIIQVSTTILDFGYVCLNSKKHMTLKISNKTASRTWVGLQFLNPKKILIVDRSEGYLKPYTVCPKSLYITVTFTPSNNTPVEDILRVSTRLPQYYIDVTVIGTGTYDEKYFYESIHDYKCFKLKQ